VTWPVGIGPSTQDIAGDPAAPGGVGGDRARGRGGPCEKEKEKEEGRRKARD